MIAQETVALFEGGKDSGFCVGDRDSVFVVLRLLIEMVAVVVVSYHYHAAKKPYASR